MARFKLYLAQGCQRSDVDDLLDNYNAEIISVDNITDHSGDVLTVDVQDHDAAAFSDDAENDFNVSCVDEVK